MKRITRGCAANPKQTEVGQLVLSLPWHPGPLDAILFERFPLGLELSDLSGRVLAFNRALSTLTGFDRRDWESSSTFSMYEQPAVGQKLREEALSAGAVQGTMAKLRRKDGTAFNAILDTEILASENGRLLLTTVRGLPGARPSGEETQPMERETGLVLQYAREMFSYQDPDLRLRWANRSYLDNFGLHGQDIINRHCYEVLHGRSSPCDDCPVKLAVNTGQPCEMETSTPEGKHLLLRGYPVIDQEGRVTGVVMLGMDITERKLIEADLRASEEQLRLITNNLPVLISYVDADYNIRFANLTYEQWYRQPLATIVGKPLRELLGESRFPRVAAHLKQALGGQARSFETESEFPDGARRVTHSTLLPHRGADGRVMGVFALVEDVTERRQIEDSLRESGQLNQQIISGARDGIVVYDRELRYLAWNPFMEEFTGVRSTEVLGKNAVELFPFLTEIDTYPALQRALKGETVFVPEFKVRLPATGMEKWATSIQTPLRNARGELIGVIEILHETTEKKRSEERQKKLEEQLYQAQKIESVGRLAGGVAHDFNNLLTTIIGSTELALASTASEAPAYGDLLDVRKAAERAAGLTRQLLAFSRKQIIEPKVVNLNEIIRGLDRMLRRLIGETLQLRAVLADGLRPVRVDPGQVEQVLTNLVVNSRDAILNEGTITIQTSEETLDEGYAKMHPGAHPGEYILMAVSDNGSGMDEATQAHLFEPFFTTKEKGKGTGLGLSTCYGIVRQNGGYIDVRSEPGSGTTVKVYLPVTGELPQPKEKPAAHPIPHGRETVLVVEDEPAVRKMIRRVLCKSGFAVLEAANGKEALTLAENEGWRIHMLLTDVVMPTMGGPELVSTLKQRLPGLRILFMSGYIEDSTVRRDVVGEGIFFVQKPFTPALLIRKVRETLDRQPGPAG